LFRHGASAMKHMFPLVYLLSLAIVSCGDDSKPASTPDAGPDGPTGAADARPDAERDAGVPDATIDQAADMSQDMGLDAGTDSAPDVASPDADQVADVFSGVDTASSCVHPSVVQKCQGGFCTIPAGCFQMGSPTSELCRSGYEPQHQVTLTHAFEMQATEVTQSQYEGLLGINPSDFKNCGASCPVEKVSWHQAVAYCNALSTQKGLTTCYSCTGSGAAVSCTIKSAYAGSNYYTCPGYRLPTDAEWEYAYRAGTTTPYYNGQGGATAALCLTSYADPTLDKIGWYQENSDASYSGCYSYGSRCLGTHPVAKKLPNGWGLYDMAGNVWEWTYDYWESYPGGPTDPAGPSSGTLRTKRGGCWIAIPQLTRAAARGKDQSTYKINCLGFRVARTK
jgi:formylglycine-generating enzyme required for sulfatase activity